MKLMTAYCEHKYETRQKTCGQNMEFLPLKAGGKYIYHHL
jgi:hypothetical protein